MKKLLFAVLALVFFLASCDENKKKETFNVNVTLTNAEGEMVYLKKYVDKKLTVVDSAVITDNFAQLKAVKDNPQDLYAIGMKGVRGTINIFPENNDIAFNGDKNGETEPVIIGSEAQTMLDDYTKKYQDYYVQGYDLYLMLMMAGDEADNEKTNDSVKNEIEKIQEEMVAFQNDFLHDNANHFVAHYILDESKQDYTIEELEEYLSIFTTESVFKNDIEDYVNRLKNTEIGSIAPDFTLKTYDGQEVTMSKLVAANKLTLIDFWASWCGPCRQENPSVKKVYEEYHQYGFDVLGVSIDEDKEKWQKAVEEDGLAWTQVCNEGEEVVNDYAIFYIPSNFLVNSEGVILAKGLRGEELYSEVSKFFSNNEQ